MLELEKKIESKNIEVRADFTRELQKVHKSAPIPEIDMSKVKSTMDLQIHNLESHFKAQFMRRIEILEDAIDTTVNRLDKFIN